MQKDDIFIEFTHIFTDGIVINLLKAIINGVYLFGVSVLFFDRVTVYWEAKERIGIFKMRNVVKEGIFAKWERYL